MRFNEDVLSQRTIDKILAMLREGLPRRLIAQQCKVSRGTVNNYANGQVPHKREIAELPLAYRKPGICQHHGKVKMPCVACAAEKYRRLHPEHEWPDPVPSLYDDRHDKDVRALNRLLDECDDYIEGIS